MHLTAGGAERLVAAYRRQNEVEQRFFGALSEKDRRELARSLADVMTSNSEQQPPD